MRVEMVIIIIIMVLITMVYYRSINKEVIYVKSYIDGKNYLVRDLKDKQSAANMISRIRQNILTLSDHLYQNKDTKYVDFKEYIETLSDRIPKTLVNESSPYSIYTSYSVNKGEQLVFCLRSKNQKNKIHDLNLLMYVALHEISHIACPETGHTKLFKEIFAFFTNVAIDNNLYEKIPFNVSPTEYCGLTISESII